MFEEFLRVGDRVRHADMGDRTAVIARFPYSPFAIVEWESTGQESSVNAAYLVPVFYRITARDATYGDVPARTVTAYKNSNREGDRVVVTLWPEGSKTHGGLPEHPAGTITCKRIKGVGVGVERIEPERIVTRNELPPDIADKL